MSEVKVISYAYDGLIYLPLFFANEMGYFPQDVFLADNPSGGDVTCIDDLRNESEYNCLGDPTRRGKTVIGVCDPLMTKNLMEATAPSRQMNRIVVFGCLIDALPVWMYTTSILDKASSLEDMYSKVSASSIDKIVYYRMPNTGGLTAQSFLDSYRQKNKRLINTILEVDFNREFDNNGALVFTSDVLKVNEYEQNPSVKFAYCSTPHLSENLKNFFFTGLVTMENTLKKDLPTLLLVLNGIRKAVVELRDVTKREEHFEQILDLSKGRLNMKFLSKNDEEKKLILRRSLAMIFKNADDDIYSRNLEIDKTRWDNNIRLRKKYQTGYVAPEYRIFSDEIPIVLIKDGWKDELIRRRDQLLRHSTANALVDFLNDPSTKFWTSFVIGVLFSILEGYLVNLVRTEQTSSTIYPTGIKLIWLGLLTTAQLTFAVVNAINYFFKIDVLPDSIARTGTLLIPPYILANILQ